MSKKGGARDVHPNAPDVGKGRTASRGGCLQALPPTVVVVALIVALVRGQR